MKSRFRFRFQALAGFAALLFCVGAPAEANSAEPRQPHVLILGDSISLGYTPFVRQLLKGEAVVMRPAENCQGTTYGVKQIERWLQLGDGQWDVIHFNFGLHDIKRVDPETGANSNDPDDPRQAEPDRYAMQLREITDKLKQTGAKLIFATTTPVPAGGVKPHRDVDDPQRYNGIAREIMKDAGAEVNDLYTFCLPRLQQIQQPVNVHFTREGSQLLAEETARHIRSMLVSGAEGNR